VTTLDDVARRWQAVVIGAGPAGALTARELARRGVAVLLVDRAAFPRRKVCGCCLNGTALAALDSVGLGELPGRLGAVPLRNVVLSAGGRSARLRLPIGAAVSREAFDAALVGEAVAAGATFLPRVRATVAQVGAACRAARGPARLAGPTQAVELDLSAAGRSIRVESKIIVAADGVGSPTMTALTGAKSIPVADSRIGAGAIAPTAPPFFAAGTVFMAVGRGGYVGAVRLEDGRVDLAAALDPAFICRSGGPAAAVATILAETDWPAIDLTELHWTGTPPLTRRPATVAGPGWFAVGDAAGYVEPFTGEGIGWALTAAAALAPIVDAKFDLGVPRFACKPCLPKDARQNTHEVLIRRRQRRCRGVAMLLRRPQLVAAAVRLLARWPTAAGPALRAWNRPLVG
jgi:flavin-dependent dehydrogenase